MPPTVLVACDSARRPVPGRVRTRVAPLLGARLSLVNVRGSDGLAGAEADDAPPPGPELRVWRAASPAAGLQELISAERPALAVLGSAHDASHGRVRLGGTAERVLHGAGRAVAVVPRGHGDRALRVDRRRPAPDATRACARCAPAPRSRAPAACRCSSSPCCGARPTRRTPPLLAARLAPAVAADPDGPAAGSSARRSTPPPSDERIVRPRRPTASTAPRGPLGRARRRCRRRAPARVRRGSGCSCSARVRTGRPASCYRAAPRARCSAARAARCCSSRAPRSPRPWGGGGR